MATRRRWKEGTLKGFSLMNSLIELIEYNTWANKRILCQVKGLALDDFIRDTHGCFPSVRHAVIHLLRSDWIWLGRWQGEGFTEMSLQWNELMIGAIESIWNGPIQHNKPVEVEPVA